MLLFSLHRSWSCNLVVFYDVSFTFSPVILLLVSFMFGSITFEGCWRLSHIVLSVVPSISI